MTRRVVWEGQHERLIMDEKPCGAVTLMRLTDYDSGAPRSIEIPAEAIAGLAAALIGEGEFGAVLAKIGDRPRPQALGEDL